jgi:hypothetical protein
MADTPLPKSAVGKKPPEPTADILHGPKQDKNDPNLHPTQQERDRAKADPGLNAPLAQGVPLNPPGAIPRAAGEWPSGQPYQENRPEDITAAAQQKLEDEQALRRKKIADAKEDLAADPNVRAGDISREASKK